MLAYEITQHIKINHPTFRVLSPSEMAHTLSVEHVSPRVILAFWDWSYSIYGMFISLNKSTSYLSVCLSLNSFCEETSRTWASLSPETRCVILIKRQGIQVPIWVLAGFKSWPMGSNLNLSCVVLALWNSVIDLLWGVLYYYTYKMLLTFYICIC